jgi:hypothetical protein
MGRVRAARRSESSLRGSLAAAAVLLLVASQACRSNGAREEPPAEPGRWWKGNTHAHTLWSDGDGAPEAVALWYRDRGYQFLVLSDHNLLSRGEKWFPVQDTPGARLDPAKVDALRSQFGDDAVEIRPTEAKDKLPGLEMRLKTLTELRKKFEVPGVFLLMEGEELTARFEQIPVHVNGLNLAEPIPPQGGGSVREMLANNLEAVREQGERLKRPVMAHINHPNFHWALTWEDLASLEGERFFEVFNGHPEAGNGGDAMHVSSEVAWDRALTRRLGSGSRDLLYGIASDDSHDYGDAGPRRSNPGRGWIVVRSDRLTPEALIAAMQRGDFYASTGVVLSDVQWNGKRYSITIAPREGEQCTTRFLGTRGQPGASAELGGSVGEVLAETRENPAVYVWHGDELYVRAVVTSSLVMDNPTPEGELQKAWAQPVR